MLTRAAWPCLAGGDSAEREISLRIGRGRGRGIGRSRTPGRGHRSGRTRADRHRLVRVRRLLCRAARRGRGGRPRSAAARRVERAVHGQRPRGLPAGDEQKRQQAALCRVARADAAVDSGRRARLRVRIDRARGQAGLSAGDQARLARLEPGRDDRRLARRSRRRRGRGRPVRRHRDRRTAGARARIHRGRAGRPRAADYRDHRARPCVFLRSQVRQLADRISLRVRAIDRAARRRSCKPPWPRRRAGYARAGARRLDRGSRRPGVGAGSEHDSRHDRAQPGAAGGAARGPAHGPAVR